MQLWDASLYQTNQQWSLEAAEPISRVTVYEFPPFLISNGLNSLTTVSGVRCQVQITYLKAGKYRYIQDIITTVNAPQFAPNLLGNIVYANSVFDKVGDTVYQGGQYLQRSTDIESTVYYTFKRPVNKIFTSPVSIQCRFEIGNKAYSFPPKICNANITLS